MAPDKTETSPMPDPPADLFLLLRPETAALFLDLFQAGVVVQAEVGATIQAFLCRGLGLEPRYVEERIQTVFLNGKAVDDLASTVIPENATIALSAAMPGLLGATLRKGSFYARMRGEISYVDTGPLLPHEGTVVLKLFNLLRGEIGPHVLSRGVWVHGERLKEFLERRLPRLAKGCIRAEADGRKVEVAHLAQEKRPEGKEVFLRVLTE